MRANVREKDLKLLRSGAGPRARALSSAAGYRTYPAGHPSGPDVEMRVLIPAFMISELRRGFEIGFLIVLPFW